MFSSHAATVGHSGTRYEARRSGLKSLGTPSIASRRVAVLGQGSRCSPYPAWFGFASLFIEATARYVRDDYPLRFAALDVRPMRSASLRSTCALCAPLRSARRAPYALRFAPLDVRPMRSASLRSTCALCAPLRSARRAPYALRFAPLDVRPMRSASLRSTCALCAPLRSARRAPYALRFAPLDVTGVLPTCTVK